MLLILFNIWQEFLACVFQVESGASVPSSFDLLENEIEYYLFICSCLKTYFCELKVRLLYITVFKL